MAAARAASRRVERPRRRGQARVRARRLQRAARQGDEADHRRRAHPRDAADDQAPDRARRADRARLAPRPARGKVKPELSLEPVARAARRAARRRRRARRRAASATARARSSRDLRDGQIALLENLRFHPGEEANDEAFARSSRRTATSTSTTRSAPRTARTRRPRAWSKFVAREGRGLRDGEGDRVPVAPARRTSTARTSPCSAARRSPTRSRCSSAARARRRDRDRRRDGEHVPRGAGQERRQVARSRATSCRSRATSCARPREEESRCTCRPTSSCGTGLDDDEADRGVASISISDHQMALDIGPGTIELFRRVLAEARTVFWNGPMGVFEKPQFASGTFAVAKALADNKLALTVVGGGDSAAAIAQAGVADKVSHISTGGGASLEFIQGMTCPASRRSRQPPSRSARALVGARSSSEIAAAFASRARARPPAPRRRACPHRAARAPVRSAAATAPGCRRSRPRRWRSPGARWLSASGHAASASASSARVVRVAGKVGDRFARSSAITVSSWRARRRSAPPRSGCRRSR